MIDIKKVAEEWEIWDKEEEVARKLVPEYFHRWIYVFGKKKLERMPTRKTWDYEIEIKKGFIPRKKKIYPLSREERRDMRIH